MYLRIAGLFHLSHEQAEGSATQPRQTCLIIEKWQLVLE